MRQALTSCASGLYYLMINTSILPGEKAKKRSKCRHCHICWCFFKCAHLGNVIACPDSPALNFIEYIYSSVDNKVIGVWFN